MTQNNLLPGCEEILALTQYSNKSSTTSPDRIKEVRENPSGFKQFIVSNTSESSPRISEKAPQAFVVN